MRVIKDGKDTITRLWGKPSSQITTYRVMKYQIREKCREGELLLNTVTGELVQLSHHEASILDKLPATYCQDMDELIARHFVVPEAYDELNTVDKLRKLLSVICGSAGVSGFSIIPTTACNARCFYCYESDVNEFPRCTMTPEIIEKVADFIDRTRNKDRNIKIDWFGGEPLLGEKQIDHLCELLSQRGIQFTSTMISNGFLFSPELVLKAKTMWKLLTVQITLDGTETVYNKSKAYVYENVNPYRRVMDNIGILLNEGIRVIIRLNLDFHNSEDLKGLIDELVLHYPNSSGLSIYTHLLFDDKGFNPVRHDLEEKGELIKLQLELNRYIESKSNRRMILELPKGKLPTLRPFYCMADNQESLLINPRGEIGKCEHSMFSHLIGNIEEGIQSDFSDASYWLETDRSNWCKRCPLYPQCGRITVCEAKEDCRQEQIDEFLKTIRFIMRECQKRKREEETYQ